MKSKQITTATSNLCQTVQSRTSGHGNGNDNKRKHQVVEKQDKIVLKQQHQQQEPKQQQQSQQLQESTILDNVRINKDEILNHERKTKKHLQFK
ncbi:unnamed protein product [Rotaria magnacalcarata]|uniref:Uncharacterized protein n=1 Tax=Rotaria socialis TaxID=392032 RepID=A0A818ECB0_9BILA|nr:unnamed protein product [Rotaria socialis]CAF3455215.1 unnamed protein product [Rotaria socialis]CAF3619000.1 unnamed protein product [Rotaria socialis]CAF4550763.1 unnamed protein product [Rotaria socialis]CAF4648150.1 unnamed protein product [Rotaria socialis]